jgi:hypothetical protein
VSERRGLECGSYFARIAKLFYSSLSAFTILCSGIFVVPNENWVRAFPQIVFGCHAMIMVCGDFFILVAFHPTA